jgi:hypothetical protein
MKNIFVDLDETLFQSYNSFWGETPAKDAVKVDIGNNEIYTVSLRKGAIKFLSEVRTRGNVYALTAATADYAAAMNRDFHLGFEYIFSRENIQSGQADSSFFIKGQTYLYDNLPKRENHSKLAWLRPLGNTIYIQVPEFYNNKKDSMTDEMITNLVSKLND